MLAASNMVLKQNLMDVYGDPITLHQSHNRSILVLGKIQHLFLFLLFSRNMITMNMLSFFFLFDLIFLFNFYYVLFSSFFLFLFFKFSFSSRLKIISFSRKGGKKAEFSAGSLGNVYMS